MFRIETILWVVDPRAIGEGQVVRSMSRIRIKTIAVTSFVAAAMLLSACGSSTSSTTASHSTTTTSAKHYTIGFSNPQGTQPVLNAFGQSLTAAAKREGIKVTSLNAGLSVSKQVSDVQQFINDKVNAIVIFPLAGPPLTPILTQARKAGIIVLGYNAFTSSTATKSQLYPYSADINQGLIHQGAKLAADYVIKKLNGKGNILGVGIAAPVPSLHAFINAEKADVTSGHSGIKWLETVADQTDNIAGAASPVSDALTKYHNNINAVMAYFDGAAEGAAQALKSAGVSAVIVGQQGNADGIAAVKSGQISATINELPYNQALIALKMVTDLLSGKSVPLVIHPPVQLITKSNLSSYVPWTTGIQEVTNGKLLPPTTLSANPTAG